MKHKIILVPFPFDDLSGFKLRPAICLSNVIGVYKHIVIAFITSQAHKANEPSDIIINITDKHFGQTGLKVTSAIRMHRLITVPINLVQRQLGSLHQDNHEVLYQTLRDLFGL